MGTISTHYLFTFFIPHPYNTVLILDSNRLEKLPSITIDVDMWTDLVHALRVCWVQIVSAIDLDRLYR